jgi:hypothetical protein
MDRLLLHLFQHEHHIAARLHAMLSATSVSPPQLDEFFAVGEAPLRAKGVRGSWVGPRRGSGRGSDQRREQM